MLKNIFRTSRDLSFKQLFQSPISAFSGVEGQKTTLLKYSLTGKKEKDGKLHLKGKESGDLAFKDDLEANLATLLSCELYTLKFWAGTKNIEIKGFEVKEVNGVIDTRGFGGVPGVRSRFVEVSGLIEIDANITDQKLQELHEKVQIACPIYNLYHAAGVKMDMKWVKKA